MSEQPAITTEEPKASIDPESVIIIHPGSQFLRIGRASDVNPKKILHAIARRRKTEKFKYADSLIVPRSNNVNLSLVENCRHRLINQLQKSIRSDGRKRISPSSKKIAEMNASQQPSFVSDVEGVRWYVFCITNRAVGTGQLRQPQGWPGFSSLASGLTTFS